MDVSAFKGFSESLDSLPNSMYSNVVELVFSYRINVFSVTVVFDKKGPVEQLVGFNLPEELLQYNSYRYCVDLESINTDNIRIYVDSHMNDGVVIYGYYFDKTGVMTEKKVYKRNGKASMLIDRYDASDNLINDNEQEIECSELDWKGPKGLINIVKTIVGNVNQYRYLFLKKISKDQTYIRVRDNPIADKSNL